MNNSNLGKIAAGIVGVAVVGLIAAYGSGFFNNQFTDGGVDVRNTKCENLASARAAVSAELSSRQQSAEGAWAEAKDKISDDYWAKNRQLEDEHHQCISRALTADPCKEAFEEVGRLYEEIMADFEAGKGFNEAKFNEREQAKKEYNDCVEQTHKPDFYKDKEAQCDAALATGQEANTQQRLSQEATAKAQYEQALAAAKNAYEQKMAILDAIEAKCTEPGGTTGVYTGAVTTGSSGTQIQQNSSACTGVFSGNDPELAKRLADLESQLQKARAAGERGGLFGIDHIQSAIDDVRQQLKDSQRSCKVDADCGDPTPVCCSGTSVGRAFCSNGVCTNEITECVDPEICTGKPAQCVAPEQGAQSTAITISRAIPEVGSCSQNLQVLDLQQSSPDSNRFEIVGNIPSWVKIDKTSGALPDKVNITYSCGTVQGFGPGVYTASGSILIKNSAGELINTIPLVIVITVEPVAIEEEMVSVIQYGNSYITIDQLHKFTGDNADECDAEEHWHANAGSAVTLDGQTVYDPGNCGFGKTATTPVMQRAVPAVSAPDGNMKIEVKGLENLKAN